MVCPADQVRNIVGEGKIIGVSTHSLTQFRAANEWDVDYIAYGPIFPTKTKDYHIGTGDIENVLNAARKPVVFIGGIDMSNVDVLFSEGVRHIAMIRSIMAADDVAERAGWYRNRLDKGSGTRELKVRVNGKSERILLEFGSLEDLIVKKGFSPGRVVVEHNLRIIPREQWASVALHDSDRIEIVSFVGGG
ncbi:MAG: sulfur carrier protein ThiS [Syntrophales bacterium]|nr:sulfur carrier protein ThiS [Syntrophales bacterium]